LFGVLEDIVQRTDKSERVNALTSTLTSGDMAKKRIDFKVAGPFCWVVWGEEFAGLAFNAW